MTTAGQVGPLQLDSSTPAGIRAFAGAPEVTSRGTFNPGKSGPTFPVYVAYGYDCTRNALAGTDQLGRAHCGTVYYVSERTGRFAAFWTNSPRFQTRAGTRPGMSGSESTRREKATATGGALANGIYRSTSRAELLIENDTCRFDDKSDPAACVGGTVSNLKIESNHAGGIGFFWT